MDIIIKQQGNHSTEDYPCIKKVKLGECAVLFIAPKTGFVIVPDSIHAIGYFSDSWFENYFLPYNSEIIIENRKCTHE